MSFERIHKIYDNCTLPSSPDYERANFLCKQIVMDSWTGAKRY